MQPRPLGAAGWWLVEQAGAERLVALNGAAPDRLESERARQRWLAEQLGGLAPRPEPLPPHGPDDDDVLAPPVLWLAAPTGWPADAPENQVLGGALLDGLGRALARLHGLVADGALPAVGNDELIGRARHRVASGLVDPDRLDRARRHLGPGAVLEQVERLAPIVAGRRRVADTVVHGSCRLETVWLSGDLPMGFLDAAGLYRGDPYRDLAGLTRSLASRFGPEGLPRFLDAYGLSDPDPVRLEFHALLDELL